MKPFYKQIVTEKIPMFEWREWIYGKLQDIVFKDQEGGEGGGEIDRKWFVMHFFYVCLCLICDEQLDIIYKDQL